MDLNNITNQFLNINSDSQLIISKLERIEIELYLFSLSIICILSYIVYIDCWLTKRKSGQFQYDAHVLM
jgi:hypothetical protein